MLSCMQYISRPCCLVCSTLVDHAVLYAVHARMMVLVIDQMPLMVFPFEVQGNDLSAWTLRLALLKNILYKLPQSCSSWGLSDCVVVCMLLPSSILFWSVTYREVFGRAIHLKISAKKMKFIFKRYLEFERQHGSSAGVEAVKEKAKAYVESRTTD